MSPDINQHPSQPLSSTHQNSHGLCLLHTRTLMASACYTPGSQPLLLYTGTHSHYLHTPEFSLQASQSLLWHTGIIFSVTILFIMSGKSPFDKLNETNYNDWKIQMEALLEEISLFGVTCGCDIMLATGPNRKGIRTFIEKQCLTHAKITLCIEPSQIPHI